MSSTTRTGRTAERWVSLWLQCRGYRIVARNLVVPGGELDIVARRGHTLHVVEVKSLRNYQGRAPGEAVGMGKRRRLLHAARRAVEGQPDSNTLQISFDVAEVQLRRAWFPSVCMLWDAFRADDVVGWRG